MPPSYFPEMMPQASGDQVMAPTPGEQSRGVGRLLPALQPFLLGLVRARGHGAGTYLVEELGQLHLHLLPLEHVVLGLLADRRDQVELPGHRVRLLQSPGVQRQRPLCLRPSPTAPRGRGGRSSSDSGSEASASTCSGISRRHAAPTMISMELQRDVPQYMAIPWLMTWVMARTVSAGEEGESGRRALGRGTHGWARARRGEGAGAAQTSCKQCTSKHQTGAGV